MIRLLVTGTILAGITVTAAAQQQHAPMSSSTMTKYAVVIDGESTPEQIPDSEAYRLWFVAHAVSLIANSQDVDRHRKHFVRIGLDPDSAQALSETLSRFKADYEKLISEYNDSVADPKAFGSDIERIMQLNTAFLQKRDLLVAETRKNLKMVLKAEYVSKIDTVVQHEKRRMKITKISQP